MEYLNKVELFKNLEQYEKLKLIDGLKVVTINSGEFIFHEGDTGEHFFIIEEGTIECGKEKDGGEFELIRSLTTGAHFGEIALINNVKRTLSVKASTNAKLMKLSQKTFSRILGSIKQYLKGDYTEQVAVTDGEFVEEAKTGDGLVEIREVDED